MVDTGSIPKGQGPAEGVSRQLVCKGSHELVLAAGEQEALQTVHAIQLLVVEQEAARIDRLPVHFCTPAADRVEVLEGDPPGIDLGVTGHTGRIIPVVLDALLESQLGDLRVGEVDLGNGRRRRRRRVVQEPLEHPDATLQRVGVLAVRVHGQKAGLGE